MIAIQAQGIGRYFGPSSQLTHLDGRGVLATLLAIAGLRVDLRRDDEVRGTRAVGGHVLKNISLEIERGSSVCITGASGSGKTTLLRILASVLPPTDGRVTIDGTVSALISVGDNLEPSRTGLEHIERQRRFRRLPAAEAENYGRDVISFAGIEGFEEIPVERYSSGMKLRLAFALAFGGNPDILLIDDVLGVGDLAFQQQCIDRLRQLRAAGSTLVMVLGDRALMLQLASRNITLVNGEISSDGPVYVGAQPISEAQIEGLSWQIADLLPENDTVAVRNVDVKQVGDQHASMLLVSFDCQIRKTPQRCRPLIDVEQGTTPILRSLYPAFTEIDQPQTLRFSVCVPVSLLSSGNYQIGIHVVSLSGNDVYSLKSSDAVKLQVQQGQSSGQDSPYLVVPLDWEISEMG